MKNFQKVFFRYNFASSNETKKCSPRITQIFTEKIKCRIMNAELKKINKKNNSQFSILNKQ